MGHRYLMVGIASLGGLIFGYQTGITAGALERGHSSWLSTATLIGAVIGAMAAGRVADLVGRRDVIMATAALLTFGAFVTAIAPSELVVLIGALVVGIGVGAISVAAPLYIAEIAPIARRGALICVFQLMITIGILLAYIGLVMFPDDAEWKLLLGAGAIPSLILSGLALLLVESPMWLALMGDRETAAVVEARLGLDSSHEQLHEVIPPARDPRLDGLSAVFLRGGEPHRLADSRAGVPRRVDDESGAHRRADPRRRSHADGIAARFGNPPTHGCLGGRVALPTNE